MNLVEHVQQGITIIKVGATRIDAASAGEFRKSISALSSRGVSRFVLDLSGVALIDSTGLGALVAALKASGRPGSVVVSGARDAVATLFRLTRMDRVFRQYPSEIEAAAALARESDAAP